MAMVSTGISITWPGTFTADIRDVNPPSPSRNSLETSHQGTETAHTFTPSKLIDWGECEVELWYDPTQRPPIDEDSSEIVITFPEGSEWTFNGFLTNFNITGSMEELATATATLKVDGDVSVTAGTSV